MKKVTVILLLSVWFCVIGFSSCSEENTYPEKTFFTTQFSVYECNEDYSENFVASSFVSIGANISIWSIDNSGETTTYKLVEVLKTGEDGKATYKHNKPMFYYSVHKYSEKGEPMSNLISPLRFERTLSNKFEVGGVFASEDEVINGSEYNLPHLSEKYIPKVGNVKFKDLNGDNAIDIEDSVNKIPVYNFSDKMTEEVVYIATE